MNMLSIIAVWFLTSCCLLFILIPAYLYYSGKLIAELRDCHEDVWKELGGIGVIKNNTITNTRKFCQFIESGGSSTNLNYFKVVGRTYYGSALAFVSAIFSMIILAAMR